MTFDEITNTANPQLLVDRPDGTSRMMSLDMLNGRFGDEVELTDMATGQTFNLRTAQTDDPLVPFQNTAADPKLGHMSVDWLWMAMSQVVDKNKLNPAAVQIRVKFFHPMDQPADPDYANNLYFEGVGMPEGDDFGSLDAAWYVGAGGINPEGQKRGLQSAKKGTRSSEWPDRLTHAERTELEKDWRMDFGQMLLDKTEAMLNRDAGGGRRINPNFAPAILKKLKMRHMVRWYDTDTQKLVTLTAEQVIAMQA